MSILLTGSTGFLGSYVLAGLLEKCAEPIVVLVRNASDDRMWRALQPHMEWDRFSAHMPRVTVLSGDLGQPRLGLSARDYERVCKETTSVLHGAATLNRKSEKACLRINLKGTLELIQLARAAHDDHGLSRFSFVSTVAVAGHRQDETVTEDGSILWDRSDYDPYARTKKFCEHMVHTLLPDVPRTIFRPSVVLGDSHRTATTQFDMVRAFALLAGLWILPLRKDHRIDVVPADYVGDAITTLHLGQPEHEIYHLAAGAGAVTFGEITHAIGASPWYAPWLGPLFSWTIARIARLRGTAAGKAGARMQVFWPYLVFNTVFDNTRVAAALGRAPTPFTSYCSALLAWSTEHNFRYPYRDAPQ